MKRTTEQFIREAKIIHGEKYDYSLTEYITRSTKVKIICPKHGEFEQQAGHHLNGFGCAACSGIKKLTAEEFIIKAKTIHGEKYDYSLIKYTNNKTKVKIICKEHGEFKQIPAGHLVGKGCPKCCGKYKTVEGFIEEAKIIHGNKYNYSLAKEYRSNKTKITIICPKHGEFEQSPSAHIHQKQGCPICNESKGEASISRYLTNLNVKFEQEKRFDDCRNKLPLPFDFYLPEHNICIEYDGEQHFKSVRRFGGRKKLTEIQYHDSIKTNYCSKNNIKLIRIRYNENVESILNNENIKYKEGNT